MSDPDKELAWTGNNAAKEFLSARSPALGSLYELATLVRATDNPQRFRILSYVGREICDRLPSIIATTKVEQRLHYEKHLVRLRNAWAKNGPSIVGEDLPDRVEIPQSLLIETLNIFRMVDEDRSRPATIKAQEMFATLAKEEAKAVGSTHAPAKEWNRVRKLFASKTHVPVNSSSEFGQFEKAEIDSTLSRMDQILQSVATDYAELMRDTDALLEDANKPAD